MSATKSGDIEFGSGDLLPLLPLRDIVVFPFMIVPLFVGREKSISALEEVMNSDRQILLFTQKNASDDDPSPESLYDIGTVAKVLQLLKLPDGTVKVLVEGLSRARVRKFTERNNYFEAVAAIIDDPDDDPVNDQQLMLNYLFGHPKSDLMLLPIGPMVNFINHNRQQPNAVIRWHTVKETHQEQSALERRQTV